MKRVIRNLMSVLLVLLMVFTTNGTAFAAERISAKKQAQSIDEVQIAKETYQNLTPEAKEIFEASLANDAELLEFHKTNVDPNFKASSSKGGITYSAASPYSLSTYSIARAAAPDPMSVLSAQFAILQLPSAVVYALKAMGSGIIAAIADGPLPIGDILLIAATVSLVIVVATHWNEIVSSWNSIIAAFKQAFSTIKKDIESAFASISSDIASELVANPQITVDGKNLKVNGVTYKCTTRADYLTASQKKGKQYMPAVLYEDHVWVAAGVSLTHKQALLIAQCNKWDAGVWAISETYAAGLCKNGKWHPAHGSEGYYPHFHHPIYTNFHCWYLG